MRTSLAPPVRGFTLIEMAVAVFILALLLGSILVPLTTQVEQRQVTDAQRALEEIKEALIGFVISNGYLPCPDTGSNGLENLTGSNCSSAEGNFPHGTVGVPGVDPWGNRYRYRVDTDFTSRAAPFFSLTSSADIRVCTTRTCSTTLPQSVLTQSPNGAVAVILSHGRNGRGATNALSGAVNPAPTSPDELENTDGDTTFVLRPLSNTTGSEFDDVLTWLSRHVLLNRMVTAGKLP